MWKKLLGKPESVLRTAWPKTSAVDSVAIKSSEYLMDAVREFRLKLKAYMIPPKAKKGQESAKPEKPTHAVVYVAKTYPPWQCTVLGVLKEAYGGNVDAVLDNKVRFWLFHCFELFIAGFFCHRKSPRNSGRSPS